MNTPRPRDLICIHYMLHQLCLEPHPNAAKYGWYNTDHLSQVNQQKRNKHILNEQFKHHVSRGWFNYYYDTYKYTQPYKRAR